jgi:hypothetical protein
VFLGLFPDKDFEALCQSDAFGACRCRGDCIYNTNLDGFGNVLLRSLTSEIKCLAELISVI